jgi:EamA domain-containing membrane protein RarD
MSYTFVNPVVALVLGAVFGAEHFSAAEVLATGIIAAGVVVLFRNSSPASKP